MRIHRSFAIVLAALVAAGCGGSGKTASGRRSPASANGRSTGTRASGGALTKSQLIEAADAICQRLNSEFAASRPASQSIHEIVRLVPRRAILEQKAVTELSELTPPSAIATSWQTLIADRRTLAKELAELGRYAKLDDIAALRALGVAKERMHRKLLATATAAGFKACALVG